MPEFDKIVLGLLVIILIVLLYLIAKVERICDILQKKDNYDVKPTPATYYEYSSATAAPKANAISMDGMADGANIAGTAPWQGMYAQTSYPKATNVSKDGMTPSPGYYAGNTNAGGGPPKIGPEELVHSVESSVPVTV